MCDTKDINDQSMLTNNQSDLSDNGGLKELDYFETLSTKIK